VIHYQWHQLDQAHHYFLRAIQVSALSGYSDAEIYYGVILSRLHQIQGDLAAADREIQKTVELMQIEAPAAVREEVISQQVRIDLAQDRLAQAETTLKGYGFTFGDRFTFPGLEPNRVIAPHAAPLYNQWC
jgi:ATP/maltotriose-dependent transcriptional regulator MalT